MLSLLLLLFPSCAQKEKEKQILCPPPPYEELSSTIDVQKPYRDESITRLADEETERILAILNCDDWLSGITKTSYDYVFALSDRKLRYVSEYGLFNDPKSSRHLFVTEEQRTYINSLLASLIAA